MRYSIEIRTSETFAEVLEKISANTEREIVPFVSAARQTAALGVKPFVSSTSGNRFRIWRVPFASKRRSRCYRYLRGQVRDVNGERHLVGSFALHPFHVIFALTPFALAATVWAWADRSAWIVIALFCAFGLAMLASATRPRPQEETEILAFLRRLFPDGNFDVHSRPCDRSRLTG